MTSHESSQAYARDLPNARDCAIRAHEHSMFERVSEDKMQCLLTFHDAGRALPAVRTVNNGLKQRVSSDSVASSDAWHDEVGQLGAANSICELAPCSASERVIRG